MEVSAFDDLIERLCRPSIAVREEETRSESRVQEAQRPILNQVNDVGIAGTHPGVQGHQEVELDEDCAQQRDREDE